MTNTNSIGRPIYKKYNKVIYKIKNLTEWFALVNKFDDFAQKAKRVHKDFLVIGRY